MQLYLKTNYSWHLHQIWAVAILISLHNSCYLRVCGVFKGGKGEFVQHKISRQQRLLSTTVCTSSLPVCCSICLQRSPFWVHEGKKSGTSYCLVQDKSMLCMPSASATVCHVKVHVQHCIFHAWYVALHSISLKISPFQKYHVGGKVMLCGAKQFIISNKIRVGVITDSEWIFYTRFLLAAYRTWHGMACRYYMGTTFCSNIAWQKILSLVCRFQIMQIGVV